MSLPVLEPLAIFRKQVDEANELGMSLQAHASDKGEALKSILATSDNPTMVQYREAVATIEEKIETLRARLVNSEAKAKEIAETLLPEVPEGFDPEAVRKSFLEKRRKVTATREALITMYGISAEDFDAAVKEAGITEVVTLRGAGKGGSVKGATGIRRARLSAATVDGKVITKGEGKGVDFTHLAKVLKVDADALKSAAYVAAGTEDLNTHPGETFTFTIGEATVTITISTEKPGRKPKAESEKATEETPAEVTPAE